MCVQASGGFPSLPCVLWLRARFALNLRVLSSSCPTVHTRYNPPLLLLPQSLAEFQEILAKEDKNLVIPKQQEALEYLNVVENAMVKGFPFEVPSEYSDLPQLKVSLRFFCSTQFTLGKLQAAARGATDQQWRG